MKPLCFILVAIAAIPLSTAAVSIAAEHSVVPETPLHFVKQHCVTCHNEAHSEGDFRADLLGDDLADLSNQKSWSRVLARVQSGEMLPPKETERPPKQEISAALAALKKAFRAEALTRRGDAGRVHVRRLNRLEYENTVRDLLDIDTPLRDLLPEDELIDGFSNQSEGLSISPVHMALREMKCALTA